MNRKLSFNPTRWFARLLGALAVLVAGSVQAHKASDSYLILRVQPSFISGEWHLALRDLDDVVGLDSNDDGAITWGELRARQTVVIAYGFSRLRIASGMQPGQILHTGFLVDRHSDGAYAVLQFEVLGLSGLHALDIDYGAFFDTDPSHRGLLRLESGGSTLLALFAPDQSKGHWDLGARVQGQAWLAFVKEGIWHIWTGYDHILFLLALLLPGVLWRHSKGWVPQRSIRPILAEVLKTVTAFSVAHSITLSLAALGVARVPSRIVESTIAASVIIAALNNLLPLFHGRGWIVAFAFGLVHGFGFANVLTDLGLNRATLVPTLLSFNLGVELGQLAIVGGFLPLALLWRERPFYRLRFMPAGSALIGGIATLWFVERAFALKWSPF